VDGTQALEVNVRDSHLTGRPDVGWAKFPLSELPPSGQATVCLSLEAPTKGLQAQGTVLLDINYKPFDDDEQVCGVGAYRLI